MSAVLRPPAGGEVPPASGTPAPLATPAAPATAAGPPLLQLDGLVKIFAGRRALDGLSLAVPRGAAVGLLGPNGSGKSTLLHLICGLLDADAGRILLDGEPLDAAGRARIGWCPQDSALYRDLRPAENLGFFARLHGLPGAERRRRVEELMHAFGLEPHAQQPVGRLSGGWRQRVDIAVAVVHRPALLLLDEPGAAVDPEARHALGTLLQQLRGKGTTIVLSTHQLDEAERLCSRIALLREGRLLAEGSVPELVARLPAQAVAWVDGVAADALQARASVLGWGLRRWGERLALLLPHGAPAATLRAVADALEGLPVTALRVQPACLELAYLELQRGGAAQVGG